MWKDGWTDSLKQLDRQTVRQIHEEMAKLILALCNFVNAFKNISCT